MKLKCELAPMLLGFILGPMMEEYLRRSLTLSRGDPSIFINRPISAAAYAQQTCQSATDTMLGSAPGEQERRPKAAHDRGRTFAQDREACRLSHKNSPRASRPESD